MNLLALSESQCLQFSQTQKTDAVLLRLDIQRQRRPGDEAAVEDTTIDRSRRRRRPSVSWSWRCLRGRRSERLWQPEAEDSMPNEATPPITNGADGRRPRHVTSDGRSDLIH